MNILDLQFIYEDFVSSKYDEDKCESVLFSKNNLSVIPGKIETDQLILKKSMYQYGNCFLPHIHVFSNKNVYRKIGYILLSTVLNPDNSEIILSITNNQSDIKRIVFEPVYNSISDNYGYKTLPESYKYFPEIDKLNLNPFNDYSIEAHQMPYFNLVKNNKDSFNNYDEYKEADTIICPNNDLGPVNNDFGVILFAKFLFDFTNESCTMDELYFRSSDSGCNGVGPGSSQLQLHLPGSWYWETSGMDSSSIL